MLRKISLLRVFTRLKTTLYRNPKSFKLGRTDTSQKVKLKGEVLYGHHPVLAALTSRKRTFYNLFVSDTFNVSNVLDHAHKIGVGVTTVDRGVLDYLCSKRPHQGVCMDVSKLSPVAISECPDDELVVYLHGVNDPMNMGAILRCCAYFGVDNVLLSDRNSCRLSPVVSRASAGAMESMNILSVSDPVSYFRMLSENHWTLIGTGVGANFHDLNSYKPKANSVLVLGNEGSGLPDDILKLCQDKICIQSSVRSAPTLDSLNVGVATGIILHHLSHKMNRI